MHTKSLVWIILFALMLPASILCLEEDGLEIIDREIDNFFKHRRRNVEEARNIIDGLYQRFPDNARVTFTKIEFDVTYLGRFEDAMELIMDNDSLLQSSVYAGPVEDLWSRLNSDMFKPLVMRVKDRRVIESAYIPNIKVDISFPGGNFLEAMLPIQLARLNYIRSPNFSTAKRFHFVPDSENAEERIIQIDYFPVSKVSGKYKMVIDRERRYPFEFSDFRADTINIFWHDEWQLHEWIPDDMITLTYPDDYTLIQNDVALHGMTAGEGYEKIELTIGDEMIHVVTDPNAGKQMTLSTLKIITLSLLMTTMVIAIFISTGGA
jgi:hypothetical protein